MELLPGYDDWKSADPNDPPDGWSELVEHAEALAAVTICETCGSANMSLDCAPEITDDGYEITLICPECCETMVIWM